MRVVCLLLCFAAVRVANAGDGHHKGPESSEFPAEFVCPEGYTVDFAHKDKNTDCVKQEGVEPTLACPKNFLPVENRFLPVENRFTPCVREFSVDYLVACPPGFEASQSKGPKKTKPTQCSKATAVEAHPSCPPDAALSPDGTQCTRTYSGPKVAVRHTKSKPCTPETACPSGFQREASGSGPVACRKEEVTSKVTESHSKRVPCETARVCPEGFEAAGRGAPDEQQGQCVRTDTAPKEAKDVTTRESCATESVCPPGFASGPRGTCSMVTTAALETRQVTDRAACAAEYVCPSGFKKHRGPGPACVSSSEVAKEAKQIMTEAHCDALVSCPPTFQRSGDGCVALETRPMETRANKVTHRSPPPCVEGAVVDDGECVFVETVVEDCCPVDFTLQGDACVRLISVPLVYTCPADCMPKQLDPAVALVAGADGKTAPTPLECVRQEATTVFACPEGFLEGAGGETCTKMEAAELEAQCPVGCQEVKGHGELVCESVTVREESYCQEGYEMVGGRTKHCERTDTALPVDVCPAGCLEAKGHGPLECYREVTETQHTCPDGFTPKGRNNCVRETVVPKISVCPAGCKKQKAKVGTPLKCYSVDSWTEQRCPVGFIEGALGDCFRETFASEQPVCPQGCHTPKSKGHKDAAAPLECVHDIAWTAMQCPEGTAEARDGSCVGQEVTAAEIICPEGAVERKGGCYFVEFKPAHAHCPSGSKEVEPAGCVSKETSPLVPSCQPGYDLVGAQCVFETRVPPALRCPEWAELRGTDCFTVPVPQTAPVATTPPTEAAEAPTESKSKSRLLRL